MNASLRRFLQTVQGQLFSLVCIFIFLVAASLTLAPAVEARSWNANLLLTYWVGVIGWALSFGIIIFFLNRNKIKSDPILIPLISLLTGWGLLTIFSISQRMGLKQTLWLTLGSTALVIGLPHTQKLLIALRKYKYLWLVGGIALTALTLIFGTNPNGVGPRLWFSFGGIYFQPSEPLKILLILYLAAYFADRQPFSTRLVSLLLPTALITGLACLILVVQRDLGTASILIMIYAALIYAATGKKRLLVISLMGIGLAAVLGYFFFDVVQLRIEAWINPWLDPFGRSYQIVQSLIAIAAGGMTGRGPGMGHPDLVPIAFSDFIFSAIGEEFGLPGTIGLVIALVLFTYRSIHIGLKAPNRHLRFVAVGIAVYIAAQSILIIGGNIRLLPLTGVTLPFLSYGGSSLLTSLSSLFLLITIQQTDLDSPQTALHTPLDSKPVIHLSAILTTGFIAIALINSWWALWRGPDLLTRTDNARRTISDSTNQRGAILDRNQVPLSYSTGSIGDFTRQYPVIESTHPVGYTHPFFGQVGAELSLDLILRGLENQSPWTIWVNHLIYGQPPPGLDAQLSLDGQKQTLAASLLQGQVGAVVLLDARSGEILVLASSPTYDPAQLTESWDLLLEDPDAPLFNRAAQGLYPPGPALAPLEIVATSTYGPLPPGLENLSVEIEDLQLDCAITPEEPLTWEKISMSGCPAPLSRLGTQIGETGLNELFTALNFYQSPEIRLETAPPYIPEGFSTPGITAYGQADILITPLQLGLAAAALTNKGLMPSPAFLINAESPEGGWISTLPDQPPTRIFTQSAAEITTQALAHKSLPLWETTAHAITNAGATLTWYLAGSLPSETTIDQVFAVVVLLEVQNAELAINIGRQILINAMVP